MDSLIYFLFIGLVAGWLAGRITKGHGFGWIHNLVIGVLGAVVGGFVFHLAGISAHNLLGSLVTATVGAIILLFLLNKFGTGKLGA